MELSGNFNSWHFDAAYSKLLIDFKQTIDSTDRYRSDDLSRVYTSNANLRRMYADHFAHLGRVFLATNADLRRRDRAGAEYKHSYNTPSFTRGCWIVIG